MFSVVIDTKDYFILLRNHKSMEKAADHVARIAKREDFPKAIIIVN